MTNLFHRVSVGQLATGGAEVCRGLSHLALLLFHSLLKQMEKEVVVIERDKRITRLNRQERNKNKEQQKEYLFYKDAHLSRKTMWKENNYNHGD